MTPGERLDEVGKAVGDLRVGMAEVKGTLSSISAQLAEAKNGDQRIDDRVRVLEQWRWRMLGASTALGLLAGWLYQVVSHR
jgi:hypothetical protein